MVADIRAPATERAGNRPSLHLHHPATSRLYTNMLRTLIRLPPYPLDAMKAKRAMAAAGKNAEPRITLQIARLANGYSPLVGTRTARYRRPCLAVV